MPSLAALPFLNLLSRSARPSDRAAFVRIFGDYAVYSKETGRIVSRDWLDALRGCLEIARPEERSAHLAMLAPFAALMRNAMQQMQALESNATQAVNGLMTYSWAPAASALTICDCSPSVVTIISVIWE